MIDFYTHRIVWYSYSLQLIHIIYQQYAIEKMHKIEWADENLKTTSFFLNIFAYLFLENYVSNYMISIYVQQFNFTINNLIFTYTLLYQLLLTNQNMSSSKKTFTLTADKSLRLLEVNIVFLHLTWTHSHLSCIAEDTIAS